MTEDAILDGSRRRRRRAREATDALRRAVVDGDECLCGRPYLRATDGRCRPCSALVDVERLVDGLCDEIVRLETWLEVCQSVIDDEDDDDGEDDGEGEKA